VDRRTEPRFELDQTVVLTILGDTDRSLPAKLKNLSGRGLRLITDIPIKLGTAVRIDVGDSMLLGEVCYCSSSPDGLVCGVQLEQALNSVADLTRLVSRLMMENMDSRSEDDSVSVDDSVKGEQRMPVRSSRR